jgi:hypothetical protein
MAWFERHPMRQRELNKPHTTILKPLVNISFTMLGTKYNAQNTANLMKAKCGQIASSLHSVKN